MNTNMNQITMVRKNIKDNFNALIQKQKELLEENQKNYIRSESVVVISSNAVYSKMKTI